MSNILTPAAHLAHEYEQQKTLFETQPAIVQRFLESQAQSIVDGVLDKKMQIRFSLPNQVILHIRQVGQPAAVTIPAELREHKAGSLWVALRRQSVHDAVLHSLRELDGSPDQAIATSANLLRYAAAMHMIANMLPAGRSVAYRPDDNEVIPSIPVDDHAPESAITQASDAIVELEPGSSTGRGEVQSPFVPAARRFYLPQWVAFDEKGSLLVGSEKEAEAHIQSMQNYVQILHRASSLAPYMVACEEYQRKRYGILGQLINQGRALANFKTAGIISEIKLRVAKHNLNRGLRISMPYFDDQNLVMAEIRFEVIPAGRIMFMPAFVVRGARGEQAKVNQDTRLNSSTRKHLLAQLTALEMAFLLK